MEDILVKILKEASNEKYAHISVKAHKASGEKCQIVEHHCSPPPV